MSSGPLFVDNIYRWWLVFTTMISIDKRAVIKAMAAQKIPSMQELAHTMGLDASHLCKLLQGAPFTSKTLERFSRALHCSPGDLIKGR